MLWLWPLLFSGTLIMAQQKPRKATPTKGVPAASKKNSQPVNPLSKSPTKPTTTKMFKPAPWISNTDVYEVNVRQYTADGTFNAFREELPRLRKMGVSTLWFMPITPIAEKGRKGKMGSPYACSDYGHESDY